MRTREPARLVALAVLAAVAATAAVGIAALARAGAALCGHRVLVHHHPPMGMAGMAAPAPAAASGGVCPILLFSAAVAAGLCLVAVGALAASRAGAPAVLTAAARFVAALRLAPLTGVVALVGSAPLIAILAGEGGIASWPALGAAGVLVAGAFVTAVALAAAARVVLAVAQRVVVAFAGVLRLVSRGAGASWSLVHHPLPVAAGVRLARRRPARAPPVRF